MSRTTPTRSDAPREEWRTQSGFILAAVGSAIGLGNIWRFPGVAYTNGGGAFLLPYIVALLTAGVVILLFDYALGHRYRGSAPAVFRRLNTKFEWIGWLQVGISFAIITYYAVIIAWAVRYVGYSVNQAWGEDSAGFFVGEFLRLIPEADAHVTADIVPAIMWPLIGVWLFVVVIMALGVSRGLERMNKIFLPLLAVLFLILVVRALFLDGAVEGLNAFFTPDWAALADPQVWVAAYSQIFFSLSVAFGIMLTYASYLPRRANLVPTGYVTAFANCSFELLAGIGVFATLGFMAVSQGVGVGELEGITGPILSFVTFPQVISMMPGGALFGVLFFGSLTLAGITSLVSLLQVVSAAFQEKFGVSRTTASVVLGVVAGGLSVWLYSSTNGLNMLDVVDNYVNNIGIVTSAVLMCFVVTFVARKLPELQRHLSVNSATSVGTWWRVFAGFITPAVLTYILLATAWSLVRDGYGGYPAWFTSTFGWGTLGLIVVAAIVLSLISWREPVDLFEPDPLTREPQRRAAAKEDQR